MNRLLAALVVFAVLAALVIGLLLSDALAEPAAIVEARARQAQANASAAEARAAQAWVQAEADRRVLPEIEQGKRWAALGSGVAYAIATIGAALAIAAWLNVRARVIYPNADGHYPIIVDRRLNGETRVIDTSRGLGPVIVLKPNGTALMPTPASEASALQIATQAQAAATMIGVASRAAAGDVSDRMQRAAGSLPAPSFARTSDDPLRLVYVSDPKQANRQKHEMELRELREIIEQGWAFGLSRERWLGATFACTGRRCSRAYWERLMERLSRANLISPNAQGGWAPTVTADEALRAFGLIPETEAVAAGRRPGDDAIE